MLNLILAQAFITEQILEKSSSSHSDFFDNLFFYVIGMVILSILLALVTRPKAFDYYVIEYKSESSGEIETIEADKYKIELVDNANGSYSGFLSSGSYKAGDSVLKIWGRNGEKMMMDEKQLFSILGVRLDPETDKSTQTEINPNYA
ncbi:MAG: hypothetical protein ABJH98_18105 [Reichenbachiella sp.]|uniref:hypothetical protein n=1 Tax=Reichenbachiella sp. TaxID=2184521 RepID=UPI0032987987